MDMELDLKVTPPNKLRWDIDGTGAGDEMNHKLRSKSYNPNMDLELDPDPELTPQKLTSLWYSYGEKNLCW